MTNSRYLSTMGEPCRSVVAQGAGARAWALVPVLGFLLAACRPAQPPEQTAPQDFLAFETRFLDAYWKQNSSFGIYVGYGKYYDELSIPDSAGLAGDLHFSRRWLDSLHAIDPERLTLGERTSWLMIENELRRAVWRMDTLQDHRWDPSLYNIGGDVYAILTQPYAPLATRLRDLSARLAQAGAYYSAALKTIQKPTRAHTHLAIAQNTGSLEVFGKDLADSIAAAGLPASERELLEQRIAQAKEAIHGYVNGLDALLADSSTAFRDPHLGQTLFDQKFAYEIVSDLSPEQIYAKALARERECHREMHRYADLLWPKYFGTRSKPTDSLALISRVIDTLSYQHVAAEHLFDTINAQLGRIERFIQEKDLFDLDTSAAVHVRLMPPYASGVTIASAEFPLPYQKHTPAYYNVADLRHKAPAEVESALREYNRWMLQMLTLHEAIPGHCMQGGYAARKSPDKVKAVFANGAMVEGWADYGEQMMMENGWAGGTAEMGLMYYKWKMRECGNAILDRGVHCLGWDEAQARDLLVRRAFQEEAQVQEKYQRALLTQVQLSSYFTGSTEILALRAAWQEKQGARYRLKDFHEAFLAQGTAPVRYIRQALIGSE
jgi:hypothetical protein